MPREPPASPPTGNATSLPAPGAEDAFYLVDLSGYVFRAYHALPPLSSSRGEPTHAVLGTVNMLQKVVVERRPHLLAFAMDSQAPTFRHALDARYKATRPPPPPDLSQQMSRVEQIVRAYDAACFQREGFEADDLIAAATERALADGRRVVIVSADKDLMQLVRDGDDRVVLWDSMRDKVYGPAEVKEKLGVVPSLVRDYLALTGDTSDNVPGVPGVGPKTATDLLTQFGSMEAIYAALDKVARPKLRESLRAHEADARLSQTLVTLDASVRIEWSQDRLTWGGAHVPELRRLYTELEFNRQLDQLDALAAPAERSPATPVEATPRVYGCLLDVESLERIAGAARTSGVLGVALATTGTDAMRVEIIGISLASEEGHGHYLPLRHRYLGCPPQLDWPKAREVLAPLMADPRVAKVGHDVKQMAIVLSRAGAPLGGPAFDTHVAAYLLDPESPNGLKDLARRELGVSVLRYEETPAKTRGPQPQFDELEVSAGRGVRRSRRGAGPRAARALRATPRRRGPRPADARRRDAAGARARGDGDARRAGGRCGAPDARAQRGAVASRHRGRLQAHRGAGTFVLRSRDQLEKILFDDLGLPVIKRTPEGRALDRRRRARGAGRSSPAARAHPRVPRARQAQGDVHRRSPSLRQPGHRDASTPASTRPSRRPGASRRATPTCRTSRFAPTSGGPSARRSSRLPGASS